MFGLSSPLHAVSPLNGSGGGADESSNGNGDMNSEEGGDASKDINIGEFAPESDYIAEDYEFNNRLRHFMRGVQITTSHRRTVEHVCAIEAGTFVTEQITMPANRRNQIMFERYTEVVGSIPATMFAELSLHDSMKIRLHGARANTNFTGEKLWDRYNIVKKIFALTT